MVANDNANEHESIWISLSELYLDTKLQQSDYEELASRILESPFSLEEVREIDKTAVFPILYLNLLTVAGAWNGFDSEWLIAAILKKKKRRNFLSQKYYDLMYLCMKGMFKDAWLEIENHLEAFKK